MAKVLLLPVSLVLFFLLLGVGRGVHGTHRETTLVFSLISRLLFHFFIFSDELISTQTDGRQTHTERERESVSRSLLLSGGAPEEEDDHHHRHHHHSLVVNDVSPSLSLSVSLRVCVTTEEKPTWPLLLGHTERLAERERETPPPESRRNTLEYASGPWPGPGISSSSYES